MSAEQQYWIAPPNRPITPFQPEPNYRAAYEYREERALDTLLNYPSNEEGLDLNRVQGFLEAEGIQMPTTIFINYNQRHILEPLLRALPGVTGGVESLAAHFPTAGITVAYRGHPFEDLNGPEFVEAMVVHESTHADPEGDLRNLVWNVNGADRVSPTYLRYGNLVRNRRTYAKEGIFYTEAFAELMRGKFVKDILGRPKGFTDEPEEIRDWNHLDFAHKMPTKYAHKHPDGLISLRASPAAYGFELLAGIDPKIISLLGAANKSVEGVRPFIEAMEAIQPGLYPMLRKLRDTTEDVTEGFKRIVSVVEAAEKKPLPPVAKFVIMDTGRGTWARKY